MTKDSLTVQQKLEQIQVDRSPRFNKHIVYVCQEMEILTIADALAKWEVDPVAKVEILQQLQDYPQYGQETHESIADLCSRFDVSDRFVKAVIIGSRETGRIFLIEDKKTYQEFHLKYQKTNDLYDWYDFLIRVVAQKYFVESQNLAVIARLDLQVLETPKKTKK